MRTVKCLLIKRNNHHLVCVSNIFQFSWLLDSQPIVEVSSLHRYAIGQYVDSAGDVVSHLNITHVRTDDGGLYRCVASNAMGSIEHAARLNVFGKSINFRWKFYALVLDCRMEPTAFFSFFCWIVHFSIQSAALYLHLTNT